MKRFVSVRIHPAGLILCIAAFLLIDSHLVLAAAAALALHECAHLLVMLVCGMRGCTIELTPFGGMADVRQFDAYHPLKRILSSGAGAAASFAAAGISLFYAPKTTFWYAFFEANLSLGFLNALPAWPLDGARIAEAIASCFGAEQAARRLLSGITVLLGAFFVLLGLVGVWHGVFNPGLLVTGPYLWYAARAERVTERVRRLDEIEQKCQHSSVLPAEIWAADAAHAKSSFAALLGRGSRSRFQVLLAIEPTSGSVQQCWTEQEMMKHLMDTGSN